MLPVRLALTLGSRLYDQQCVGVRLRRTQLPALDRLEILLPPHVEFDSEPGEECSLELDGGEGGVMVFTGVLTGILRGLNGLQLTAHNGGRVLAGIRPSVTFEKLSVGDIIDRLCGDAEVSVARRAEGPMLALHAMAGRATAAEEIAGLAAWAGARAAFDGEGELHVTEEGGPGAELALRYGREMTGAEISNSLDPGVAFTVVGEGAGEPDTPEARWIVTDFLKGGGTPAGPRARRVPIPALRSTDDTETAARALAREAAAAGTSLRLRLWMHPRIEPGMRLELADLPDTVPATECRVRQVVSTLRPGHPATTEVWATAQAATASEFGGLPSLAGGLL